MSRWDSQLVTGEAVALDLRTAAVPSRAVAAGIDALAQVVLLVGLGFAVVSGMSGSSLAAQQAASIAGIVVVLIGYPVAFETALRGRTPGKAALGLRVVRDDGGPIGFRQALVRGLFGAFLEKPGLLLGIPAVVCSLLNSRNKRLGDLFAGTVVLRERVASRDGVVAQLPPQLAPWASSLELSQLGDDLALALRQFVSRAPELTDSAREDLGGRLVRAVLQVTAPPPPPGTPGWAVLHAVLAERRRREELRLSPARPTQTFQQGQALQPVQPADSARAPQGQLPSQATSGFAPPS